MNDHERSGKQLMNFRSSIYNIENLIKEKNSEKFFKKISILKEKNKEKLLN